MRNVFLDFDRNEFLTPFDKIFDRMLVTSFPEITKEVGVDAFKNAAYPKCDIVDFDDRMEFTFEIPGLTKEQVSIDIDNDVLCISGQRSNDTKNTDIRYIIRELKKSSFKRSFRIDKTKFNLDDITAKFTDGILELIVYKHEASLPTKRRVLIE
jgi:HSP20 family protein